MRQHSSGSAIMILVLSQAQEAMGGKSSIYLERLFAGLLTWQQDASYSLLESDRRISVPRAASLSAPGRQAAGHSRGKGGPRVETEAAQVHGRVRVVAKQAPAAADCLHCWNGSVSWEGRVSVGNRAHHASR